MKPLSTKPRLYAYYFGELQEAAKNLGYNLLLSGSLQRDCDLVAVAWVDDYKPSIELIKAFDRIINGWSCDVLEHYLYKVLGGGREAYVINVNRGEENSKLGGKYVGEDGLLKEPFASDPNFKLDPEMYLDISVVNNNQTNKK